MVSSKQFCVIIIYNIGIFTKNSTMTMLKSVQYAVRSVCSAWKYCSRSNSVSQTVENVTESCTNRAYMETAKEYN